MRAPFGGTSKLLDTQPLLQLHPRIMLPVSHSSVATTRDEVWDDPPNGEFAVLGEAKLPFPPGDDLVTESVMALTGAIQGT